MTYNLYIKDTGYLQTSLAGTPYTVESDATAEEIASGEFQAYDGQFLMLKIESIDYTRENDIDKTPSASGRSAYLRMNSINLPSVTLTGYINQTNIISIEDPDFGPVSVNEMRVVQLLDKMASTKGHKDVVFDQEGNNEFITLIAPNFKNTSADTETPYVHLNVAIAGIKFSNTSNKRLHRFTLTLDVTNE